MPKMLLIPIVINTGSLSKLVSIIEDKTEFIDSGRKEQQPSARIEDQNLCFVPISSAKISIS